jgi:hypothetical protein
VEGKKPGFPPTPGNATAGSFSRPGWNPHLREMHEAQNE